MAKKKKTRVKPKLTPEQLAEMGRLPNGHFAKGNKIAQVYPDGFFELSLKTFDEWLFSQAMYEGEEENKKVFMYDFYVHYREIYGVTFTRVVASMHENAPELYKEYLAMREIMAENLIKIASEGKLKEQSIRFYLNSRFNWSEKTETKNENINKEIVWKEIKTYESETIDYEEEENDE